MAAARSSWDGTEVADPLGKAGPSFGNAWEQDGRGECLASSRPPVSQTRSSFWDTSAPCLRHFLPPSCHVSLLGPNKLFILTRRPCSAFLLPRGLGWLSLGNQPAPWSHGPSIQPGGKAQLCWRDTSQWRRDTGPRGRGSSLSMLWLLEFVVCGHGASRGDLMSVHPLESCSPLLLAVSCQPHFSHPKDENLSLSLLSGAMAAIQ